MASREPSCGRTPNVGSSITAPPPASSSDIGSVSRRSRSGKLVAGSAAEPDEIVGQAGSSGSAGTVSSSDGHGVESMAESGEGSWIALGCAGTDATICWMLCCSVDEIVCATLVDVEEIDCTRSPSSPGLRIRIATVVLQAVHESDESAPQLHCQFHTQPVSPPALAGLVVLVPVESSAQFHDQFQVQFCGTLDNESDEIDGDDSAV